MTTPTDLTGRRARSGFAQQAKRLLQLIRETDADVQRLTVNGQRPRLLALAKEQLARRTAKYITITHPAKDPS